MIAIQVSDLCVYVGTTRLIGPISFRIKSGANLVIMGETGSGKSLIVQAILGALPLGLHAEGSIWLNQTRVDTLSYAKRAALWGHVITTLPQEPWRALDPLMQSWRQVAETHRHVSALPRVAAEKATAADLRSLGLKNQGAYLPGMLSGGMAQRVAFVAAMAGKASIVLVDEPTKGLDAERLNKIIQLLAHISQAGGALLAITHERSVAQTLGGELIVLRDGNVVEQGQSVEILATPQARYTKALFAADPATWPSRKKTNPRGKVVLDVQNLSIQRGKRVLIEHCNFTLHEGERIAICGPSGVGKTSMLDALAGLISPSSGRVSRAHWLTKHAVQKLYQDPPAAFPPSIPVGTTVRDVARLHRCPWESVEQYMDDLSLQPSLLDRRPDAVSGGELQRMAIVRALIASPKVLLADEPTNRLDLITQKQTLDVMTAISREKFIAIIMVTHNQDIAQKWADRSIFLSFQ